MTKVAILITTRRVNFSTFRRRRFAVPPVEAHEVSLIRGGPFYSAQLVTRLIHPGQWNLGRRVIFVVAIGWIPLILLTALFQPAALVTVRFVNGTVAEEPNPGQRLIVLSDCC